MTSQSLRKLVVASGSPRRKELLRDAGFDFEVLVSNIPEAPKDREKPADYVIRNSKEKALAVCLTHSAKVKDCVVLGADTVVVSPLGRILEKPTDAQDAQQMLSSLSGNVHQVVSGFSLIHGNTGDVIHTEAVATRVVFRHLNDVELVDYIATGEPFDKAGGYGIQGHAASFVSSLEGSYTNVVGLPLAQVVEALKKHTALMIRLVRT